MEEINAVVVGFDSEMNSAPDGPFGDDRHYYETIFKIDFRTIGMNPRNYTLKENRGEHSDPVSVLVNTENWYKKNLYDVGDMVNITLDNTLLPEITDVTFKNTFFECLLAEMVRISTQNSIPTQAYDTWLHSNYVWELAEKVANKAISNNNKVDFEFLKKASYVHDFGRMYVGSKASKELEPAYLHGIRGKEYFEGIFNDHDKYLELVDQNEANKFARICERHMGGAGLTKATNERMGLAKTDTLAETIEEKIVGYSDWRIHAVECNGVYSPKEVSEKDALSRTENMKGMNASQLEAVNNLRTYIHKITNGFF